MADPSSSVFPCGEFSEFKEALEAARKVDDGIIYRLNTSIPTLSFKNEISATEKCKGLYEEVNTVHATRRTGIQSCIEYTSTKIGALRSRRDQEPSNDKVMKDLRNEQTKLRLMKNELTVEDIARDRTMKVFKERCWQSFKPPNLQ
ncbi:PREDICTED: coiled-coil domain-containing protein 58-like [Amphimedon queenslandica]|uniref:Protein MIX23 n=1 Tax=Amphimedon queenslandica TaxID=400682 RepID=A0A1X7TY06_AMPQE|nr:PREDICTED: coiled-coil domain-containing protein 58-like [Amphimedon queenslandica]|eukprot:XP_003389534.1 PREDICTED: coiled-coil domain-containing protein 58-like [Amphimedon queenslandica]